jgi:hypothetical protein
MKWLSLETQLRLIGGLVVLLAGYFAWMGQLTLDGLPDGYKNPVLALELVEKGTHIDQINRAQKKVGDQIVTANAFISRQLRKDSGFIILYVLLFSLLAFALAQLTRAQWKWAALVGIACAVLAGILDFVENSGMRKALALTQGEGTDELANMIRYPSLAKWALTFIFLVLIGLIFILGRQAGSLHALGFGFLLLLGGLVGLSGVIANLCKPQNYVMFPLALLVQAVGFVWLALVFLIRPAAIVSRFK